MTRNMKKKLRNHWHAPVVCIGIAALGTACLIFAPMAYKPVAFLFWGGAFAYGLAWIIFGSDLERGWCERYFDEIEHRRRLERQWARKHPRSSRSGEFTSKEGQS